jgi:methionyl-tRNA formyltransferase
MASKSEILIISDNLDLARFFLEQFNRPEVQAIGRAELRYSGKAPSAVAQLGATRVDLSDQQQVGDITRKFDLVISAHCKKIFPAALVRNVRCVNFHPGFNPHNRGWYPQVFSIINGKPLGATVHEMNEDIDAGPVIAQREVKISSVDTSASAYAKVIEMEKELISETLPDIIRGTYEATAPETTGNYNGIADYRQLCHLDLDSRATLREHLNLFRALSHPPFWNAYFLDEDGKKVFVRVEMETG